VTRDKRETGWGPMPTMRELIGVTTAEVLLHGLRRFGQGVVSMAELGLQRLDPDGQLSMAEEAIAERLEVVANGTAAPPQPDDETVAAIRVELDIAANLVYIPTEESELPDGESCEIVDLSSRFRRPEPPAAS